VIPRSYLYVPGTRLDRVAKAIAAGPDAVMIDLEDSVPVAEKDRVRDAVAALLADPPPTGATELWVRVNPGERGLDDLRAVAAAPALTGVWTAKTETAGELHAVAAVLDALEASAIVEPLLETAAAVQRAAELARAPRARRLQLGEVDLAVDLGVTPGADERELEWVRAALVAASAAAGCGSPIAPVSREFRDLGAFAASTAALLRMGYRGRACIHPAQVPVANAAFTPSEEDLAGARDVLDRLRAAADGGTGSATDAEGRMIDEAVARAARRMLEQARGIAEAQAVRSPSRS